jgi:hypothetical protein
VTPTWAASLRPPRMPKELGHYRGGCSEMSTMRGLGLTEGERFQEREKARGSQVYVPAVVDRYVMLAIQYMNIWVLGAAVGEVVLSSLVLICGLRCLGVSCV